MLYCDYDVQVAETAKLSEESLLTTSVHKLTYVG